jgi:hypothetical protein
MGPRRPAVVVAGRTLALSRSVGVAPLELGLPAPEGLHELVELVAHGRG